MFFKIVHHCSIVASFMAKEKLCHNGSCNGEGFWYDYVKTSRDKWSSANNVSLIEQQFAELQELSSEF
jgi:hypothetical protein